jgi:hypothetical protein
VQYPQQGQPQYDPVAAQQIAGGGGYPVAPASHQQIYQQQQPGQQIPYAPAGYPAAGAIGGVQRVPNTAASSAGTSASNVAIAAAATLDPYQLQQSLHLHHQQQQQQQLQQQQAQALAAAAVAAAASGPASAGGGGIPYATASSAPAPAPAAAVAAAASSRSSLVRPRAGRLPATRPVVKLSVGLIDTYKHINTVYYEERDARRAARSKEKTSTAAAADAATAAMSETGAGGGPGGAQNDGWDDENYDYIVTPGEIFFGRYRMMERIGKGSFGQVVRAEDIETKREVAIKIIKSKKPFLLQAKTEIELLTTLFEKDPKDQHNLGTNDEEGAAIVLRFLALTLLLFTHFFLSTSLYESISAATDPLHVPESSVYRVRNAVSQPVRAAQEHPVWRCFAQPNS